MINELVPIFIANKNKANRLDDKSGRKSRETDREDM